ncbi:hypothetical protein vseg_015395 [Gypsophila vaccaria]
MATDTNDSSTTKIDSSSPFYTALHDRPGDFITPVRLKLNNYDEWSHAIRLALRARRKFGFLDGTIKSPTPPATKADWETVHSMLVSWLSNTIDPEVKSLLPRYEDAKRLWDDLSERFNVVNGPRIQQLKSDINDCSQTNTMSVAVYFSKLSMLWDELDKHEPLISCSCGKCECDVGKQHAARRDSDRVHRFLLGLESKSYGHLRSNLLSHDPLPNLNRAFQAISQEERVRGMDRTKEPISEVTGFSVRSSSPSVSRSSSYLTKADKQKLVCTHCKKRGHDVSMCFDLLDELPDWWYELKGAKPPGKGGRGRGNTSARGSNNVVSRAHMVDASATSAGVTAAGPVTVCGTPSHTLSGKWIIDTGCSHHVTGNLQALIDVHEVPACPVGLPDGQQVLATRVGRISLTPSLTLDRVLYVPQLTCNLISASQLSDAIPCEFITNSSSCLIQALPTRVVIGTGDRLDGLYYLRCEPSYVAGSIDVCSAGSALTLWHHRLGHPSEKVVKLLPFLKANNRHLPSPCEVCHRAKHTRDRFPLSCSHSTKPFELVHCDLWGPYDPPACSGGRYFFTLVDDFSRAVWIFLLNDKTMVFETFMNFVAMVDNQFSTTIKSVRSDNGTEFNCLKSYFRTNGILFQTSCVGTPQQNGRVERKHQHILNVARALRFHAGLPIKFWGECALAAVHLINRTPSLVLNGKTPFEVLFGSPPSFDDLRVFGSLCFAHNQRAKGDKFASRSRKCVFMGYPYGKKGWYLFDLERDEFFVSRDVKFYEDIFPFKDTEASNKASSTYDVLLPLEALDDSVWFCDDEAPSVLPPPSSPTPSADTNVRTTAISPAVSPATSANSAPTTTTTTTADIEGAAEMGRGYRRKFPSTALNDYVVETITRGNTPSSVGHVTVCSPPSGTPYPIAHYVNCDKFSVAHRQFLAAITNHTEPRNFKEAFKDAGWRAAMETEMNALEANGTWTLEPLPPGKKALGSQWLYKIKYKSDSTIERLKARLVVFGNHQTEGIDYDETFAPVAKMTTVRTFLAVAAAKNWALHQMDVHNAFLHGDLEEEVYMRLPPGFSSPLPGMVCRLRKSLYGLKQAPRCWFEKLVTALKQYGFLQSYADYSLFTFTKGLVQLNVLVYVDDLLISGNDIVVMSAFKDYLHSCFHMKDLGVLKYFLGIEVARNSDGIFLCQRKYILDIISEVGCLGCKPETTPIVPNHGLGRSDSPLLKDPEPFRRLVGRLVYLSVTRPDLTYAVHVLSQFISAPRQDHWDTALRTVRYLKGTPGQGILLRSDCDLSLTGWCDSDWAACPTTRRSLTGWFVFLGHSPISWKTKKQHTVSRSSAEAEYRAMAALTCELKWLKGVLLSLGIHHPRAAPIFCDSQSALYIAQNPVFHERTKHIEVDCHFVRDAITEGLISPSHVSTTVQLADILTKALGVSQFANLLGKLGIANPYSPT